MVSRTSSLPVSRTGGQWNGKWLGLPFLVTVTVTFVYVLTPTRPLDEVFGGVQMRTAVLLPPAHLKCGDPNAVNVSATTVVEMALPTDLGDFLRLMAPLPIFAIDASLIKCILAGDNCTRLDSIRLFRFAVDFVNWSCTQDYLIRLFEKEDNRGWSVDAAATGIDGLQLVKNDRRFLISRMQLPKDSDYAIFPNFDNSVAVPRFQTALVLIRSSNDTRENGTVRIWMPANADLFFWHWERGRFLSCNRTLADRLRVEFPDQYAEKPQISDSSITDLAEFRQLLVELGIAPMLFGGSLLGWYRECGIIPHTTDLDMAAFASEYSSLLLTRIKWDQRFKFYWMLGKPTDSLELSVYANGVKIDLFFIYHDGTNGSDWVGGMNVAKREKLRWNYPLIDEVCTGELKGHLMFVPCNVEEVLSADYGSRWDVPHLTKDFVWHSSHHNIEQQGRWSLTELRSVYRTKLF